MWPPPYSNREHSPPLMTTRFASLTLCLLLAGPAVCQQTAAAPAQPAASASQPHPCPPQPPPAPAHPPAPAPQPNPAPPQPNLIEVDSIQVTTTIEPLPLAESDRSVLVIAPNDLPIGTDSAVDLLRTDPSLNLQARAAEGVQADLAIRGTTFEQSLILVNGFRVNDPETGHLNLDIPVPLDAI